LTKLGFYGNSYKSVFFIFQGDLMTYLNATVKRITNGPNDMLFICHVDAPSNPTVCKWDPLEINQTQASDLTMKGGLQSYMHGKIALIQKGEIKSYYICHFNAYFQNSNIINHDAKWEPIEISEAMALDLESNKDCWIQSITMNSAQNIHIGDNYYSNQPTVQAWEGTSSIRAAHAYDIRIGRFGRR
jgi:hypothetical protein